MTASDVDVLIVGGGPTGVTLGLELAMQNISFRIVDKEPGRSDKSRALVVQPRSLELLNRYGIASELVESGLRNKGVQLFIDHKLIFNVSLEELTFEDSLFPSVCFISQADTEAILDQGLERYGKAVEHSMTAESVTEDGNLVTTTLKNAAGKEELLRSKYVVGCDGAHSVVRHAAGLKFDGAPYPQDFILAECRLVWEGQQDNLILYVGKSFLAMFPLRDGRMRLMSGRPGGIASHDEPTFADFEKLLQDIVPGKIEMVERGWITRFRLHHRGVDSYRKGRLFVAGDAAHIHSPAGGQGMNTGIQDAVNLGWKLGRVIRGEKNDSLLDSYNYERYRVGTRLLQSTDQMFTWATSTNPIFLFLRSLVGPLVVPWVTSNKTRVFNFVRFVTQLGIRYRTSPIIGNASKYSGKVKGGDRAPDGKLQGAKGPTSMLDLCTGPNHTLILFSGTGAAVASSEVLQVAADDFMVGNACWVKTHQIFTKSEDFVDGTLDEGGVLHSRYGFTEPSFVLLRPDLYIAFVGPLTAMDELKAFAAK